MFTDLQIPAGRRPLSRGEAIVSAAVGIAFTIMILAAVFEEYSNGRLGVVLVLLFWVPMLVLHELGHAVAAKLLGWRVQEIVIGFGPDLWVGRIGETRVRIKLAPVEGYVLPAATSAQWLRSKSALIYAAGPGAELLLLAAMTLVLGWDFVFGAANSLGEVAAQSLAVAILLGAGFNLLPFSTDGGVSDGLGILSSPFISQAAIEVRLLSPELRQIGDFSNQGDAAAALSLIADCRRRFPNNHYLQQRQMAVLISAEETAAARDLAREALAQTALSEAERLDWLYWQARTELRAAEPSWLVFDLALQQAAAIAAPDADFLALRGAGLVQRGEAAQGGEKLAEAWRQRGGRTTDAEILAYLVLAAKTVGDAGATKRFAQAFQQVNKSAFLRALLAGSAPRRITT